MSSLQIDEGGRRGRSRSPSGRRDRSPGPANVVEASPYDRGDRDDKRSATYEYERYSSYKPESPTDNGYYRGSREKVDEDVRVKYTDSRRDKEYRYEKEKVVERDSERDRYGNKERDRERERETFRADAYLPQKYAVKTAEPSSPKASRDSLRDREWDRERERDRDYERERPREKERERARDRHDDDLAYGGRHSPPRHSRAESPPSTYAYAQPKQWEYAKPDEKISYTREETTRYSTQGGALDARHAGGRAPSPGPQYSSKETKKYYRESYGGDPRDSRDPRRSSSSVVTVEPGLGPGSRNIKRSSSPQPPAARMSSLSVSTPHHSASLSVSAAPASPLLESYHGTYQSMSPMPSPLLLPSHGPHDPQVLEALSPAGSDDERSGDKKRSRRARFHDPVDDAARLAKALKGEKRAPDTEPLIEILPGLTHEQVMELRTEYKRLVKTGSEKKGVNIAKHIRARLKDEDPSLMKACYAVALGQWESESYWANFWYQGDKTRRELLIESLMGRTNDEIRMIKDGFSDKKYSNSLTKCMKMELKEDKFKKAVLMVLDEQRMDDFDAYGRPVRLDRDLVADDVRQLHHAVKAEKGGESLMITIVVQRSDSHLREVLKLYNDQYGSNFARDALKKSGNLVGELLAHILNGVINKPTRDALLIQHALTSSKKDELRRELLISRLVRYHWDRRHMAAVKVAFRERYGKDLQDAVKEGTSGEWGLFCRELCITRMPDDVRRVEKVEIIKG